MTGEAASHREVVRNEDRPVIESQGIQVSGASVDMEDIRQGGRHDRPRGWELV